MCLSKITSRKPKKTGFGYKVFQKHQGKLIGDCKCISKERVVGKKIYADDISKSYSKAKTIFSDTNSKYPVGFHVFKNLGSAVKWMGWSTQGDTSTHCIRKVKYYGAHTEGTQMDGKVIVAGAIKIFTQDIIPVKWKGKIL